MLSGIKEILLISTPRDILVFEELFGDGTHLGVSISYKVQPSPDGLAQAFILGEEFIGDDSVCLVLGDNIYYGYGLADILMRSAEIKNGATIFGYYVNDPQRYGVVEFDENKNVIDLEEKPANPKSNYAVTGLYYYDNTVVEKAKGIKPSSRGELEITDLNKIYLKEGSLKTELLGRGMAWLDTGTHESLIQASNFVASIEQRQGLKVACLEEIAYRKGYINDSQLKQLAEPLKKNQYGQYLLRLLDKSKQTF